MTWMLLFALSLEVMPRKLFFDQMLVDIGRDRER